MTQNEVAEKLDISESFYCQIEKGNRKKEMSIKMLEELSTIFNVEQDEILVGERESGNL